MTQDRSLRRSPPSPERSSGRTRPAAAEAPFRPPPPFVGTRSLAAAALRVNLMVVVPVTLLLFTFAPVKTWERFWRVALLVTVVCNCNVVLLAVFRRAVWSRLRFRSTVLPYIGLALVILPVAALISATAAWTILVSLSWFDVPPLLELLQINVPLVVVYGVSYYVMSDYRSRLAGLSADLSASQRGHDETMLERDELKLFALQIFLNPHFLFNSLNTIVSLIHEDPRKAEAATLSLARVLRRILETRDTAVVELRTELAIVTDYLEIEKIRLGERLSFSIDVPEDMLDAEVPAMIVQPLVENAIKHGVRQRPGGGHVRVRAWTSAGQCHIEVIDDGPGVTSHYGTGQARRLLQDRMAALYGCGNFEMSLVRDDVRGQTIAGISLPLRTELRKSS